MAMAAINNQSKRIVNVSRDKLLDVLRTNRTKHLFNYNAAMEGYKAFATEKINEAFTGLARKLNKQKAEMLAKIDTFSPETASKFSDSLQILQGVWVELKVPVSYVEHYDAAIEMTQAEVHDVMQLTGAEFECFWRDRWDWTGDFTTTAAFYASGRR